MPENRVADQNIKGDRGLSKQKHENKELMLEVR